MTTMELQLVENRMPVKIVYTDNKETINFKSLVDASRTTGIKSEVIKRGLNPVRKKRYNKDGREFVFRIINNTLYNKLFRTRLPPSRISLNSESKNMKYYTETLEKFQTIFQAIFHLKNEIMLFLKLIIVSNNSTNIFFGG